MSALKNDNITVETIAVDFEKIDVFKEKIPPCDLVIASHVFYYMKDLKKALSDAQALRKEEGRSRIEYHWYNGLILLCIDLNFI